MPPTIVLTSLSPSLQRSQPTISSLNQSFPEPFRSEHGRCGRTTLEGTERGYLLEMGNCGNGAERGSLAARLRVRLVLSFQHVL